MKETSRDPCARPVGYGLVASPLPPSLSLPHKGGEDGGASSLDPSAIENCGRFFHRLRGTDATTTPVHGTDSQVSLTPAPGNPPPPLWGRVGEGGEPHGVKSASTPAHDHVIGSTGAKPAPDLLAVARIHPAGAARA